MSTKLLFSICSKTSNEFFDKQSILFHKNKCTRSIIDCSGYVYLDQSPGPRQHFKPDKFLFLRGFD